MTGSTPRDDNYIPVLAAISSADGKTIVYLEADPVTHRLLTSAAGGSNFATREVPTGAIDGVNTTYTLANTPTAGSESVFLNGILLNSGAGNDYTITTNTITMASPPQIGDKLLVSYRY